MARRIGGKFNVSVTSNTWAGGTLDASDPQSVTYTQTGSSTALSVSHFSANIQDVGWEVRGLVKDGEAQPKLHFKKGVYTQGAASEDRGRINGGVVTGFPTTVVGVGGTEDSWTAVSAGLGAEIAEPAGA
jgi:hypothetical protein